MKLLFDIFPVVLFFAAFKFYDISELGFKKNLIRAVMQALMLARYIDEKKAD